MLLKWFIYAFYWRFALANQLTFPSISPGPRVRLWQVVSSLVDESTILQDLYAVITGIDDENQNDDTLLERVVRILSYEYREASDMVPILYQTMPGSSSDSSRDNYFVLNEEKHKSAESVFYLKTKDLDYQYRVPQSQILETGEKLVGVNADSPILLFYGCDRSEEFEDFNRNLFSEAQGGKIRFVWRSTCPNDQDFEFQPLATTLTVKEKTWGENVIDDSFIDVPSSLRPNTGALALFRPSSDMLSSMGLKVASLISDCYSETQDFQKCFHLLRQVVNNFPVIGEKLAELPDPSPAWNTFIDVMRSKGIDHNFLGLYINGLNLRLTDLDFYSFAKAILSEFRNIQLVRQLLAKRTSSKDIPVPLAKRLIEEFSSLSLDTMQWNQPIRYDLHRIPGFSESIFYVNDIENDDVYADLSSELPVFLKDSKYGELPQYRENWNELIFVLDLSRLHEPGTLEALNGFIRAIDVTKGGYPQRLGFLPLATNNASAQLLREVYFIKENHPDDLVEYLKDMNFSKYEPIGSLDDISVPPVTQILQHNLKVNSTSLIVNGQIFPFKHNTWNYFIAQVIKKDVEFLKGELPKYTKTGNFKVRDLLHYKSFTLRDPKYLPDFIQDSTFFTLDLGQLDKLPGRVIEFKGDEVLNKIHTVTLVDDFGTKSAISRLINLLSIKLFGVRFRLIHKGQLNNHWKQIAKHAVEGNSGPILKLSEQIRDDIKSGELDKNVLKSFLPGATDLQVTSSFLLINGRYISLGKDEIPEAITLESILQREALRTKDCVLALEKIMPESVDDEVDPDFIEMLSAALSKIFYCGNNYFDNGIDYTAQSKISRLNFNRLVDYPSLGGFRRDAIEQPVDVTLILDPLEERTQKLLELTSAVVDIPWINVQIILLPAKDIKLMPIHRIWVSGYSKLSFEVHKQFDTDLEVPSHLHVTESNNNVIVDYMVIEVNAFESDQIPSTGVVEGVPGLCLQLIDSRGDVISSTTTMNTFGFGQLKAFTLGQNYTIKSCDSRYSVEGFSPNGRSDFLAAPSLDLTDLTPQRIYVKVAKLNDSAPQDLLNEEVLNIFTILNGLGDQAEYKKMVLNVASHSRSPIRFWYTTTPSESEKLADFLEFVSQNSKGEISFERVDYVWPRWLRPQRFLKRELAAVKVLLLDVLFPLDVHQIVYLSPNADIGDLNFTQKPTTRVFTIPRASDADQNSYWKAGYWKEFLEKNNLQFHKMDTVFIVNMNLYREKFAGDKLRIHYQRLSADFNSLGNVDQDLVNYVQVEIPIKTLSKREFKQEAIPQEVILKLNALESKLKNLKVEAEKLNAGDQVEDSFEKFDDTLDHDEL
ncbi:LAMI_0F06106g1_1 [Lachancea mirantina]|uniref:LAMI_0F06106g1_1 n=1 Tax=Lachancea mirantina TaxID=1230905 RepID=A0A1G4JYQ5_9SACH|nr:LAMI_0F06106g1_1 [Lachancea mirantina]